MAEVRSRLTQTIRFVNEPNFHYMIANREGTPWKVVEAEREALYAMALPEAYTLIKKE